MSIFDQIAAQAKALIASERFYIFWALHKNISAKAWGVVVYDRVLIENSVDTSNKERVNFN